MPRRIFMLLLIIHFTGSCVHAKQPDAAYPSGIRRSNHRPPVSFLFGLHQSRNTGVEIGFSRSVDYGYAGNRNFTNLTWSHTLSLTTEFYGGDNTLIAPKLSLWFTIKKINPLCFGTSACYVYDLAESSHYKVFRPEVGIHFRIPKIFINSPGGLYNYRAKLVYGYNFSTNPELIGTHQVSLVLFRVHNHFGGKIVK